MDSPSQLPSRTNLLSTYFCRIHDSLSALKQPPGECPPPPRRPQRMAAALPPAVGSGLVPSLLWTLRLVDAVDDIIPQNAQQLESLSGSVISGLKVVSMLREFHLQLFRLPPVQRERPHLGQVDPQTPAGGSKHGSLAPPPRHPPPPQVLTCARPNTRCTA